MTKKAEANKTPNGVKLLVCGFESSGKSTITSDLKDALVFNFDQKEYNFKTPHVNLKDYTSMEDTIEWMISVINKYKEQYGDIPKIVVLDTVTQLYTLMQKQNDIRYTGFDSHRNNNKETMAFNEFIEKSLIPSGIHVVVVAHTIWDEPTSRHVIPATGAFAKSGSWLSIVNDSVFLLKQSGKITAHLKSLKYPARTTLEDIPESVRMEEFDLSEHINKLAELKTGSDAFCLD